MRRQKAHERHGTAAREGGRSGTVENERDEMTEFGGVNEVDRLGGTVIRRERRNTLRRDRDSIHKFGRPKSIASMNLNSELPKMSKRSTVREGEDNVSVMSALTQESEDEGNLNGVERREAEEGDGEMKIRLRSVSEAATVNRRLSLVQTKEKVRSVWGRLKNRRRQQQQQQQQQQQDDARGRNLKSPWRRLLS